MWAVSRKRIKLWDVYVAENGCHCINLLITDRDLSEGIDSLKFEVYDNSDPEHLKFIGDGEKYKSVISHRKDDTKYDDVVLDALSSIIDFIQIENCF